MSTDTPPAAASGFMDSIVSSNSRLIRAIFFLLIIGFGLFQIISLLLQRIYSSGNIDIEVNDKGGIIFKVGKGSGSDGKNRTLAAFLLPASDTWMDTGLDLDPGDKCEFKITGNVHLALNNLSKAIGRNKTPEIGWTGPNGSPWAAIGDKPECQKAKRSLLLSSGEIIGNVIGYAYEGDLSFTDEGFITYFLKNKDAISTGIFTVGSDGSHINQSTKKQRLFLSVNDILLDTTTAAKKEISRIAYEGRTAHPDAQKWDSLLQNGKYYRLWFNDNIGGFLVSVTITHKLK